MAIVRNPAMSMDASGNMGALCYTRWRGRKIARARSTIVVVPTPDQIIYEARVADLAYRWGHVLGTSQRAAWVAWAKSLQRIDTLGQTYTPSGYSAFMTANLNRLSVGRGYLNTPLTVWSNTCVSSLSLSYNVGLNRVTATPAGWQSSEIPDRIQYWRAGPFASGGRRAQKHDYRYKIYKTLGAAWVDVAVSPGAWYWYAVRAVLENGQALTWVEEQIETV